MSSALTQQAKRTIRCPRRQPLPDLDESKRQPVTGPNAQGRTVLRHRLNVISA